MKKFIICGLPLLLAACNQNDMPIPDLASTLEMSQTIEKSTNFVTLDEALAKGDEAFDGIFGKATRSESRTPVTVELWNTTNSNTRATDNDMGGFYIVNYKDGGFSILSSDKRREAVYAISDTGYLNLADTTENDGLCWYLNEGIPLMDKALSANAPLPRDTTLQQISTSNYIPISSNHLSGFLSKFSQEAPYNAYCFTSDGGQSYVGCAPLAVGTICGYFKHPQSHQGYTFNWEQMYANPSHENWARLFSLIGDRKNMNAYYTYNGTGADPSKLDRTFSNLGFKNHQHKAFSSITVSSELGASRPVLTYGFNSKGGYNTDGHAWIIDGGYKHVTYFQDTDPSPTTDHETITKYYFHCVWGWGGYANAYYLYDNTLGGKPDLLLKDESGYCPIEFGYLNIVYGFEKNN